MHALGVAFLSAVAGMCFTSAVSAQMPTYTKAGPIPMALTTAKTLFISNAGSNAYLSPKANLYKGDADRPYTEFYAALKATGHFPLVNDPAQADLVLEIGLFTSRQPPDMFQLVVYDTKTHYILWTITRGIEPFNRPSTGDKNFDTALSDLLNQFLEITGKAPAAAH